MSLLEQVILLDVFSARPAAGIFGRLFFASDTGAAYRDNGSTWDTLTIGAGAITIAGPYADDTAAAAGGVAVGSPYYLSTGFVVARLV